MKVNKCLNCQKVSLDRAIKRYCPKCLEKVFDRVLGWSIPHEKTLQDEKKEQSS